MTVTEFTRLDSAGTMFELVDATKPAYYTNPSVLIECDKNVARVRFGHREVVSFAPKSKKVITLYVR